MNGVNKYFDVIFSSLPPMKDSFVKLEEANQLPSREVTGKKIKLIHLSETVVLILGILGSNMKFTLNKQEVNVE